MTNENRRLDSTEKLARIVLWLALASAVVLAPIQYVKAHAAEAELKDALKKSEEKAVAELEKAAAEVAKASEKRRTEQLPLKQMGVYLSSLNAEKQQGHMWVTNVSGRSGALCVVGIARSGKGTAESMATCQPVGPYASDVHLIASFAGLSDLCHGADCALSFRDATPGKE